MLYDFLKNNKHIDRYNINDYVDNLPCLEEINMIEKAWNYILHVISINKKGCYGIIGNIIREMYKSNIFDRKAVLFLKQRASDAIFRYRQNYFRTLDLVFSKIEEERYVVHSTYIPRELFLENEKKRELSNFINNKWGI